MYACFCSEIGSVVEQKWITFDALNNFLPYAAFWSVFQLYFELAEVSEIHARLDD